MGPAGPQGPSGVVATVSFAGAAPGNIGLNGFWQFIGPTASVTITSTQRLVGAGSAVMGHLTLIETELSIGLCYQVGAGAVTNFTGNQVLDPVVSHPRQTFSVAASVVPGVAGTYTVGYCVLNPAPAGPITDNGGVQGHVLVVD